MAKPQTIRLKNKKKVIPKKNRLQTRAFSFVYKKSEQKKTRAGLFLFQKSGKGQCSVVVRKKDAKKAVERNKIRRELYNALKNAGFTGVSAGRSIWIYTPPQKKAFLTKKERETLLFSVAQSIVAQHAEFSALKDEKTEKSSLFLPL